MGRKCLCNALLANIGYAQIRSDGTVEPALVTVGDDLNTVAQFLAPGRESYSAAEVVERLRGANAEPQAEPELAPGLRALPPSLRPPQTPSARDLPARAAQETPHAALSGTSRRSNRSCLTGHSPFRVQSSRESTSRMRSGSPCASDKGNSARQSAPDSTTYGAP